MAQKDRELLFKIAEAIRKLSQPPQTTYAPSSGQPSNPPNQPQPTITYTPLPPLK